MKVQRNRRGASGGRAEDQEVKLLVVGRDSELKNATRRVTGENRFRVAGRSVSLLGALQRLQSGAIDLVLLGCEFHDEEVALFSADARRLGFTGLILRVASKPRSNSDLSSSSLSLALPKGPLDDSLHKARMISGTHQESARDDNSISFTARQGTVLARVSEGWSNQQIARQIKCTEGSVKATLQQLFQKLGVRKRAQIVRLAFEKALLQASDAYRPAHGTRWELANRAAVPTDFQKDKPIHAGDFFIDVAMHRVWVRGVETHLSPSEFELLTVFALHPGKLLRNKMLLEMFWRNPTTKQDSLRVLIRGLRTKIETSTFPRYIVTERNFGYRFIASPSSSQDRSRGSEERLGR
jgi:DNA-binding CsgD family transcriptional regulator/DNA-binding winged helix-turn-helix (wHTH) protein